MHALSRISLPSKPFTISENARPHRLLSKVCGVVVSRIAFLAKVAVLTTCVSLTAIAGNQKSEPTTTLPYTYSALGNPDANVTAPTTHNTASLVLMGGGPDVDGAFEWMIGRAGITPKTGGRFVIIRATGTDAYNPYIYYSDATNSTSQTVSDGWVGGASKGLTSVETLVIPSSSAANLDVVNAIVSRANAVFIAGGDQADYITYWKGTKLHATLQDLLARNVPIGGTSAGLAVLGQFDFAALNGTVTSKQALADPYNQYMTFDPNPLSLVGGFLAPPALNYTILDSHLDTRDRMGRLITFTGRLVKPGTANTGCFGGILDAHSSSANSARGIGIGVETALLVRQDYKAGPYLAQRTTNSTPDSEAAVYFVRPSVAPSICAARKNLTMYTVEIKKLATSGQDFNLSTWSPIQESAVTKKWVDVISGKLTSSPY